MKKSIKIAMIMFVASCLSAPVFAGDIKIGIGAGATESGSTVYIPIKVPMDGNFILLEPSLSMMKYTDEDNGVEVSDFQRSDYGIGLFFGRPLTENIDLLIGGRVSYVDYERKDSYGKDSLDGFAIAPTLGIEYNVNPHITIGGFVDYTYSRLEGTEETYTGSTDDTEREIIKPNTNLFVKFYF